MRRPAKLSDLPQAEWNHWQAVLDRFEQAWRDADTVDLGQFLPPAEAAVRPLILQELIKSELEIRWRRGRGVLLEEYQERFPELARDPVLWPPLLHEEYRVRRLYGDRPLLADYRTRYPEQFAELERLLETDSVLPESSSTLNPVGGTVHPVPPTPQAVPPPPPPPVAAGHLGMIQRDMVLPGGGDYKLLDRLGSGQFGMVYRAEAPGGVEVAVKIIFRPLDHADAQRELEALEVVKRLRHPFLVQIHRFYPLQDRLIIVMELGDGNLRGRFRECRQAGQTGIQPAELLGYTEEASDALDYLHERRVLHRDIKPDNILLLQRHAKLADLGLARVLEMQRSFTATTCGSPPYMAPEVWLQHPCAQSDQYSLAATYVELRLGRALFPGKDWVAMMLAHREERPDLAPLPGAEQAVLLRALAKEPGERFPNCLEFCRALRGAFAPAHDWPTIHGSPPPGGEPPSGVTAAGSGGSKTPLVSELARRTEAAPDDRGHDTADRQPETTESPDLSSTLSPTRKPTQTEATPPWRQEGSPTAPAAAVPRTPPRRTPSPGGRVRALPWVAAALVPLLLVGAVLYLRGLGTGNAVNPTERTSTETERPARWVTVPGAQDRKVGEKTYPDHIARVWPDGLRIEFRLIVPDDGEPAFYIMQTKVSNQMFQKFVAEKSPPTSDWLQGAKRKGQDLGIDGTYRFCPVYRVPLDVAHRFASWLGGELPTAKQWDWTADRYHVPRPTGPYRPTANPGDVGGLALAETGPQKVGTAWRDECPYSKCQDMATNGYEWTCSICRTKNRQIDESERVDFTRSENVPVSLRGASYEDKQPFTFAALDPSPEVRERRRTDLTDVSFRVVLPVPPGPVIEDR
jgi:serine/threonine protein kinase